MKRVFDPNEPELMDRPQPITPELEADLKNLVSLNRLFGSHRLLRSFLTQWLAPGRTYTVLDLATGSGDLPRVMVEWARARDISLRVDAVDANESTLEIARRLSREFPEITFMRGNALTFQNAPSYDLVCCSLALHHFSDEDAVVLLRRCRELSHRFVLVADLERSGATLAGVYVVTTLLFPAPMTRADGVMSARRAFSFSELRELATAAGWEDFGHDRFLFCRQAIWLDGRDAGDVPHGEVSLADGFPCPT